ncbi:MAG: dprA, partial [Chlamydiales bacterium]|nr:dprA [Chlamydiales bacterium]
LQALGPIQIRRLITFFGSAREVLANSASLPPAFKIKGVSSKAILSLKDWPLQKGWQEDLKLAEQHAVSLIFENDPLYPSSLKGLKDAPLVLYVKGTLLQEEPAVAIVGTRNASFYGQEMASQIAQDLAKKLAIISGLARGIDTKAHLGALKSGRTIAVIGSGLADIYPRENIKLADKIAEKGAVISEMPMRTPPERHLFPKRNRLVAALSLATVLIEAPLSSGAMLTARLAIEQNKPLFALPGRVDMSTFGGNHLLLKERQALFIESAEDVFTELKIPAPLSSPTLSSDIIPLESHLLEMLGSCEMSIDEIALKSQLSVAKIGVLLMSLVLKRKIEEFPGKIYKKKIG